MNELENNFITKIEGHGNLNINLRKKTAHLEVAEGERLFEALIVGRLFSDAPHITARICGICPTAHMLSSINAIENAFGINPSQTTLDLRKLILAAQICQSHSLHLYFLALPDYLKISSSLELPEKFPDIFNNGLSLKRLFDEIVKIIGGRSVHPLTPQVGGFSQYPTKNQLLVLRDKIEDAFETAIKTIDLFFSFNYPEVNREVEFMSLKNDKTYPALSGIVWSSEGYGFDSSKYSEIFEEILKPYSSAKFAVLKNSEKKDKSFITGARARMAVYADLLNPKTKAKYLEHCGKLGPYNPFFNNLAQAVEIGHFMEEMIDLINKIVVNLENAQNTKFTPCASIGTGVVEAPRGLLYHQYEFDKSGNILRADIVTPTSQNLASIEEEVENFLIEIGDQNVERTKKLLEMLIRSYDPCITCAVH